MINIEARQDDIRHQVIAEVLELGESLFDDVIEAAAHRRLASEEDEAFPVEDVRAAAEEFFRALRILLRVEQHNEQR